MVNKKLKPEDEGSEGVEEEEKKEKPPVQTQMQQLARFFYCIKYLNFHEIDEKTAKTRKSARDLFL